MREERKIDMERKWNKRRRRRRKNLAIVSTGIAVIKPCLHAPKIEMEMRKNINAIKSKNHVKDYALFHNISIMWHFLFCVSRATSKRVTKEEEEDRKKYKRRVSYVWFLLGKASDWANIETKNDEIKQQQQNRNTRSHKFLFNGNVSCYVASSFVRPNYHDFSYLMYYNSFLFIASYNRPRNTTNYNWLWSSESETENREKKKKILRMHANCGHTRLFARPKLMRLKQNVEQI